MIKLSVKLDKVLNNLIKKNHPDQAYFLFLNFAQSFIVNK